MECFNYYLIYGKDQIAQNQSLMSKFFEMATKAMFTQEQVISINNSEGALLLSIILQIFKDKQGLNMFIEPALDKVIERLKNNGQG